MQMSKKIVLENVSIAVGIDTILKGVNWTIRAGEHWVITGDCGVGKTTLAEFLTYRHRMIEGARTYLFLENPNSLEELRTSIRMISFTDTSDLFLNRRSVHYYQQRYNAFDSDGHLRVREYLESGGFSLEPKQELLDKIGITPLLDKERIKLSSGQTRKLLLAKVMFAQPKILIVDNPYLGLDHTSRKVLNNLLDDLVANSTDLTLILSGHHRELPKCITHRLHIDKDRTIHCGEKSSFHQDRPPVSIDQDQIEQIKTCFASIDSSEWPKEVIRMEGVSIQYHDQIILNSINWEVLRGEKWVVFGPNGSGKSTLLSLIYGDNPQAYAKRIWLFGQRRGSGESIWEIKRRIGYTSPELHAYFLDNPSARNLVLTGLTDTFSLLREPSDSEIKLLKLLFEYFELQDKMDTPFRQLSTGTQRLLLFMRTLIKVPPVLLLDEPFQALDTDWVEKCKHLLNRVLQKHQTLIFISHYREEWPEGVGKVLDLNN